MVVSVKAYLNYEMAEPENRRFSITDEMSSSYEALFAKIVSIFPSVNLQGKELHLCWKDADEQLVAISTDEELTQAVDNITDGVLHIYLKLDNTAPENGNNSSCQPVDFSEMELGFEHLTGRHDLFGGGGFHLLAGRRGGLINSRMVRGFCRVHPYGGRGCGLRRGRGCNHLMHGGLRMQNFGCLGFGDPRMGYSFSVRGSVFGADFCDPMEHSRTFGRGVHFGAPHRGFFNPRMSFIPMPVMPRMIGPQF